MSSERERGPWRWTVANVLTAFRLAVAVPLMLACALAGAREAFLWVLAASFFSDAVDGTVARLTGRVTRFGALLDSWADVAAYSAIAIAVGLLWPELVRREWLPFATVVASFVVPSLAGLAKFRRFTSYHTRLVKLAVGATALGLWVLLWGGPAWPFRAAALLALIAALEEVMITLVLDQPRSNVRGIAAVWRAKRAWDTGGSRR